MTLVASKVVTGMDLHVDVHVSTCILGFFEVRGMCDKVSLVASTSGM